MGIRGMVARGNCGEKVGALQGGGGGPTSQAPLPLKLFFAVFVEICSSENIFDVFNIFHFFRIQNQKNVSLKKKKNSSTFAKFFLALSIKSLISPDLKYFATKCPPTDKSFKAISNIFSINSRD